MDPVTMARQQAGRELQTLAEEFASSDEAAFLRTRIACIVVSVAATLFFLVLLIAGGDWRQVGLFWVGLLVVLWAAFWLSQRRQRAQTRRLMELAESWQRSAAAPPPPPL